MNYPRFSLASIITPGIYSVVSKEEEHQTEVAQVEEHLAKEVRNAAVTPDLKIKCQMCVAVETLNGKFKRGVIEEKLSDKHYEVLLIDYGETVIVDESVIHIITNKAHLNVEPLSFIVKLFGVMPAEMCMINGERKARVTRRWQPHVEAIVKNLFVDNKEIIVQRILIKQRIVYGDILFKAEQRKFKSLRKFLCKNDLCAYSRIHFLRQEGLDLPTDDISERESKMEFVERWQRENFGDFQQSDVLPFTFSHSNSSVTSPTESLTVQDDIEQKTEAGKPPDTPKNPIGGRGKLKFLLSEMKRLQIKNPVNAESSTLGCHAVTSDAPGPAPKPKSYDDGQFEDADFSSSQSTQDAVTQPEKCFLGSDGNLTECLEKDSPPPLIGQNPVRDECAEFPKKKEKTYTIKTKSEMLESAGCSSSEIKYSDLKNVEKRSNEKLKTDFLDYKTPLKHILRDYWAPFVVFGDSVVEPVNTFRELPIQASVIRNLEKGGYFNELSEVQRWAIPAIRKQLDTIVIGSSKTGKTMSYLVPLTDYIQDDFYFEELPEGNGPTIVIVASSSRVCESIYYMFNSLLGNLVTQNMFDSKVKIVLAHGNGCEKEVWVTLTNGCDILISTPHCLARLLEYPIITNFERLTCLVLDEIDVLTQKHFRKQTRVILEKANLSTKDRHYQKIFCGEKWTPDVENFVESYIRSYALIIGSYLEAVIYQRFKPKIYFVLQNQKAETLLEKIKDDIGKMKIVIACENPLDAIFLGDFLNEKNISSLVAHDKMMSDKLKEIAKSWRAWPQFVLVVTDGVLNEMKIREAQVLVHYGLPVKSKTNFFLRYSAFENFIRKTRQIQRIKDENYINKLVDIILVDDENHFQLPHIIDFVMRLGSRVSENVLRKSEEIRRVIESSKKDAPICRNLLSFGRCQISKSCPQRHALIESSDSPGRLPSSGWVNFTVIKVHNASLMSVRLVEHVKAGKNACKFNDRFLEIPVKLAEIFKSEENRRPLGTPSVGDICAVKNEVLGQEVFFRAQVIECLKKDEYGRPIEVNLKLLDQGDVWKRKNVELYELPKDLAEYPAVAVDVRVAGLQPLDVDTSWSQIADAYVKNILTQTLQENQYWSGKIVLALNGVLFLNPIKRKEFLPHLNTHVFDLVLQDHLICNRVAVKNEEHLPSLINLCSEAGIQLPGEKEVVREDTAKIQPQWAFFDSDIVEVKFLSVNLSSVFFLLPKKYEKLLKQLDRDCQTEGNRVMKEISRKPEGSAGCRMTVGSFCLAKFEDQKWNRGRIESEAEDFFEVFFVDHGDISRIKKTFVIPISDLLLLRHPCQAIECRLVGVRKDLEYPVEVLEEFYHFSDDGTASLHAIIIEKTRADVTGGWKYSVNLLNGRGDSFNRFLVAWGKVPAEDSESGVLENVGMTFDAEKENEEEEDKDEDSDNQFNEENTDSNDRKLGLNEFNIAKYLNEMEDLMFDNEEAKAFLREFSSEHLTEKTTPKNQLAITDGSEKLSPATDIAANPVKKAKSEMTDEEVPGISSEKPKKDLTLIKSEKVLTPQVLWSQNHSKVRMKIVVENVRDYALDCTATNLAFRCYVKEKLYAFDLKLYGSINPQMTKLTLKALHVVIILTKLVSPFWPRLHRDEGKHFWVNLDVEGIADKKDAITERIKAVKRDMEAGIFKEGVKDVKIRPCSDSEVEEEDFDSEYESE